MEFLIKKLQGKNTNSATLKEVADKLELAVIKKNQLITKKEIAELKKLPKIKELDELFSKKFKHEGIVENLTGAPSMEKNDKIKVGSVYFNSKTDKLRLKIKSGWVTVNTE